MGDGSLQFAPINDHVDRPGLHQELCTLKSLGELLAHGVLDHPRAGEANQCLRFCDHHVPHEGEAGRHAAHGGIGEHADVGQFRLGQSRQGGIHLGHLHQAQQAFLHACATRRGEADKRNLLIACHLDATHEPLADHRAHGSAHELELETGSHQREAVHRASHHDQGIGFAGVFQRILQTLGVLLAVLELQGIDRNDLLADLEATLGVEERIQAGPRTDSVVVTALGADIDVLLQVGLVEHGFAGGALDPEPLRHGAPLARVGLLNFGGQQFL